MLAGCADAQPEPAEPELATDPVRILVPTETTEDRVVAEIFRQTLHSADRNAELVDAAQSNNASDATPAESLRFGKANLWLACTGEALSAFNRSEAKDLESDYAKVQAGQLNEDFVATTHIALIGSLPPALVTVDPSSAEGCTDEEENSVDLPQNFTPIFNKQLFDRDERNLVAAVAKFLTAQDIQDLSAEAEKRASSSASSDAEDRAIAAVVGEWMDSEVPAAEINEGSDSDGDSDTELS